MYISSEKHGDGNEKREQDRLTMCNQGSATNTLLIPPAVLYETIIIKVSTDDPRLT